MIQPKTARSAWAVILCIGLAMLAACGGGTSDESTYPKTMRIGHYTMPNPYGVAVKKGWFDQAPEGMKIEFVELQGTAEGIAGLASGDLDIALLGNPGVATALSQGIDLNVVWAYDQIGASEALVVRDDLDVAEPADLRGKSIGVAMGSTNHYSLLGYLQSGGVKPSEVDIVDLGASDLFAAFSRGDIDGGYVQAPVSTNMVDKGGKTVVTSEDMAELGFGTYNLAAANAKFVQKYPDALEFYLSVLDRSVQFYKDSPDDSYQIMGEYLDLPVDETKALMVGSVYATAAEQSSQEWLGGAIAETVTKNAEFWKEDKRIDRAVPAEDVDRAVTAKYVEEVAKASPSS